MRKRALSVFLIIAMLMPIAANSAMAQEENILIADQIINASDTTVREDNKVPLSLDEKKTEIEKVEIASGYCGGDWTAEYDEESGAYKNLTWVLYDDGELVISGTGMMMNIVYWYGAPWYSNSEIIKTIVLSEGVTSISYNVFNEWMNITSITIPSTVTYIGWGAFSECTSLTRIDVDADNSYYCSVDGVLFNKDMTTLVTYPISKAETAYTIPSGVTSIGRDAFHNCMRLTSIFIPANVAEIGENAFQNCYNLSDLELEAGSKLTCIVDRTFMNCRSLESISIPSDVTSIGYCAFVGCRSLTDITIPSSVTSIGEGAFTGCECLTGITIPSGVTSIDERTFADCYSLESITIPSAVTTIGDNAFNGCTSITSIVIPSNVISIGDYTFAGCASLEDVSIPSSVSRIGDYVFLYCTNLTQIDVDADNACYCSVDGVLFNKDMTTLVAYPARKTNTEYTIPLSVTSIGTGALSDCTNLESIVIPSGVTSIGDCDSLIVG